MNPASAARSDNRRTDPDASIDLLGLFDVLVRRRVVILAALLSCVLLAVVALSVITPRYTAVARLLIDPREQRLMQNEVRQRGVGNDLLLVDSQMEIITSEAVLSRVVEGERLTEDTEFAVPSDRARGRDPQDVVLENLAKAVKVARADNTYVLEIGVTSKEAAKAARLANAVAEAYTQDQAASSADATRRVASSIQDRLDELQARLQEAERKVEEFKRTNDVSNAEGRLLIERQVSEISSRLSAAAGQTMEAKARMDTIEAALRERGDVSSVAAELGDSTMSALRNQLAEAQRRMAELEQVLGPRHPRLASAQADVSRARQAIREESRRIAAAARDSYQAARDTEAALRANLDELKSSSFGTNSDLITLRELEREAQSTRVVYEAFLVRAKEAAEQENLGAATARIIAPASVPDQPSFPPRTLLLLASVVLGLGIGILAAILWDLFAGRGVAPRRAETAAARRPSAAVGIPVPAGAVPASLPGQVDTLDDAMVIVMTVREPALARRAALELARRAAHEGMSSLFIDLASGRDRGGPGLADLAAGRASVSQVIQLDASSNAHVVDGGSAEAMADLTHESMQRSLKVFAATYDRIVVNLGLLYADAGEASAAVVERADHAVLVVRDDLEDPADIHAYEELADGASFAVSVVAVDDEDLDKAA